MALQLTPAAFGVGSAALRRTSWLGCPSRPVFVQRASQSGAETFQHEVAVAALASVIVGSDGHGVAEPVGDALSLAR